MGKVTSGVAEKDFLKVDGTAMEGRSDAEVLSDIGGITASSTDTLTNKTIDAAQLSRTVLDARLPASISSYITGNAATATLASTATVSDSTANTNFPVVFHDESNALLDDTGALRYNPSTGELLVPKLTVAGTTTTVDTVTMNAANAIIFEGATADAFETTLTIQDPTGSDKTITLPNATGTVLLADGDGSSLTNVDAQTLDSLDSTQFLRSDAADTKTSGNLNFSDNVQAKFGDGGDLSIFHDGTNSYIHQTDATLFIRNTSETANASGTAIDIRNADDTGIEILNNSGVTIKRNGNTSVTFTSIGAYFATDIVLNGSTRELKFRDTTAGDFDLTLDAAQITNSDKTITLPNATGTVPVFTTAPTGAIADGTNGQVLTTNGSGGLSFTTVSGGGGGGISAGKSIIFSMVFG